MQAKKFAIKSYQIAGCTYIPHRFNHSLMRIRGTWTSRKGLKHLITRSLRRFKTMRLLRMLKILQKDGILMIPMTLKMHICHTICRPICQRRTIILRRFYTSNSLHKFYFHPGSRSSWGPLINTSVVQMVTRKWFLTQTRSSTHDNTRCIFMMEQSNNIQIASLLRAYIQGQMTMKTNITYQRNSLTIIKMSMPLAAMICTSPEITAINI